MNKKPYLLFDFDGTLADSFGLGLKIYNQHAVQHHLEPVSDELFQKLRGIPTHKAIRLLKIPFYRIPKLIPLFLKEYRDIIHHLKPFPDIHKLLESLHQQNIGMALLTSNTVDNVQHFLELHNLEYFDWVEHSSGLFKKQHTIAHQIKKHSLQSSEVIYIGDETRDIIAAHKCGIRIISVTWGLHTSELLASFRPDFIADNPQEIKDIVSSFL